MNKLGKKNRWQYSEARTKLCEVVRKARTIGPQFIARRDGETVVCLSVKQFQKNLRRKTRSGGAS